MWYYDVNNNDASTETMCSFLIELQHGTVEDNCINEIIVPTLTVD